jgi:hypothetical protein
MPVAHGYPKEWIDSQSPGTFKHAEFLPNHATRLP